jgi:hypothetical protein
MGTLISGTVSVVLQGVDDSGRLLAAGLALSAAAVGAETDNNMRDATSATARAGFLLILVRWLFNCISLVKLVLGLLPA